ncbi:MULTISPECIES: alanine/glycine:cation symporter family protein [Sulfitobacter]|jgi:AGCS family alanine or glycine:cation symporter|uniref:Amino-acid carrier protein AlsT n=4 Tax=Sulfitobacter TaxID=60136 RepID=A0AAX3ABA6_9RHOB|nr:MULTISPECIES: alanine/glycine:cation symporter family protein [Sulfitobacter]MAX75687.1 alanine:cation symporter family protein [Roseobacter sp.]PTA98417.1 alanine:cation symporter family protein [Sulfitobacter sp. CB-A]QLL42116.1 alanine:cation symporter family protein [Sulfitobacter pontiacus]ULO19457.1 alanine:cation symporter family protein [Sulfitobacter sp. CB2047]UOA22726.1 Amino-acid carrier protein AlsT [Sulfitobacter pontiacus]|tara:strand:+ start:412 stop:1839 length:1428 start_codon:yes stop_codon:yes gene_type:complete
MEFLQTLFGWIGDFTWGWSLIPILVIFGIFITIATGFVQIEYFGRMFRVLSNKNNADDSNQISAREALLVSVGGRVGGGNIAGVAVAITLGGPGAVFWMWAIALVGMATSLVECSLAQLFKRKVGEHSYRGGPAAAIIHGLGKEYRWLAVIYAICLIAAFGLGFNAFQGNTVAGSMQDSFGIDRLWTGIALAAISGFIIFGGIHRIAKVSDVVVPIMAIGYLAMALIVILLNITSLPGVIYDIVTNAFGLQEAVGGGMGAAVAQGLRRGLFSNEAGLGSAPNVAATAEVRHPISQGITQSFSVFIDTIIICSCTAFVILLGDVYVPGAEGIDGVALTQQSMVSHLGTWVQYFLSGAILLFSFSSIIYNYYLGENAMTVLTKSPLGILGLRIAIIAIVFLGATAPAATAVFFFSDPMMGILALVNLLAIMMLFPVAMRLLRDFRRQLKAGVERPVLNPDDYADLDIDRDAWKLPAE